MSSHYYFKIKFYKNFSNYIQAVFTSAEDNH